MRLYFYVRLLAILALHAVAGFLVVTVMHPCIPVAGVNIVACIHAGFASVTVVLALAGVF
jgi:hypothetical protein